MIGCCAATVSTVLLSSLIVGHEYEEPYEGLHFLQAKLAARTPLPIRRQLAVPKGAQGAELPRAACQPRMAEGLHAASFERCLLQMASLQGKEMNPTALCQAATPRVSEKIWPREYTGTVFAPFNSETVITL